MNQLPDSAEVVIIGGGIVGCSIAYHLTRSGVKEVVLLEQNQLTAGTTWHAAGLVGQLRATHNMTRLAKYTAGLFAELEAETGQATGYRQTGSLTLALNKERMVELQRQASTARAFGVEIEALSPQEAAAFWPGLNTDDAVGAVYLPGDGQTNPVDTTQALAAGARQQGALIFERQQVLEILTSDGAATGVRTSGGTIRARQVVLAGGMWSRQLAAAVGVSVPLMAAEHFYIVTEPLASLTPGMPTLRIPDEFAYLKEDAGKLLLGAFEPVAKPWSPDGVSADFAFGTLPEDFDHFAPILELAAKRYPQLETAGIQLFFNGPESFTPDDRYLLGETPELKNFFVASGFNSIGIQSSGGAGKVLAEWMVNGHPPMDLWDVDIRRTFPFQSTRKYLLQRTRETLGLLYAMHWPYRQYETARGARRSPFHERLIDYGAVMGELGGWERPNWYVQGNTKAHYEYSYGPQNWFDCCKKECLAVRDNVALFDLASYPVFYLQGPDAVAVLNNICANNIDVAVNAIVYTQWLNERGGIEADVTVTRTGADEFMIVSSCASELRDFHWLTSHIPADARAHAWNASSGITMIGVMGPNSRALLQAVSPTDLSNEAFPYYHSAMIEVGYTRCRANRLSYVGELGYELYIPTEFAMHVLEELLHVGRDFDLALAGYHAMNACRVEKGYRHFGHDISDEVTPVAAGLGFAVDMSKSAFIGKAALEALPAKHTERLVNFVIDADNPPLIYHDEPVFCGDELVGISTSGAWGYRLEKSVGIASIRHAAGVTSGYLKDNAFAIEVAGQRYPLQLQLAPFYDRQSSRMKV
ncbi:MAG: FAD-dependent oxidoreductase [Pseudomonadales bacterium]|nr:FAD-dependent oxidoreductase [Pseudomonadales bacterium]